MKSSELKQALVSAINIVTSSSIRSRAKGRKRIDATPYWCHLRWRSSHFLGGEIYHNYLSIRVNYAETYPQAGTNARSGLSSNHRQEQHPSLNPDVDSDRQTARLLQGHRRVSEATESCWHFWISPFLVTHLCWDQIKWAIWKGCQL
jgi:hypothetical protein